MSTQNESQDSPKILLSTFMPSAIVVILLVLLNVLRPALVNGSWSTIFSVTFWIALILALVSLIGLAWYFLRQMASKGFSFMERLSLGILIPSAIIVFGMVLLDITDPGGIMAGAAVDQLFWGMFSIMSVSLMLFAFLQLTKNGRRRKKKGKMYYY